MQLSDATRYPPVAKNTNSPPSQMGRCRVGHAATRIPAWSAPPVQTGQPTTRRVAGELARRTELSLHRQRGGEQRGLTILELMVAVAIIGVLAAIAFPLYRGYVESAEIAGAVIDIRAISTVVEDFKTDYGRFPETLAEVGMDGMRDPWGNPYQYLNIETAEGKGELRKDKFLVPLNTDFDLYSMGKDGDSKPPLTAKASHDDIVRANNGSYVGIATGY